ncbi:MAG: tRNA glutamyl-Q(34) synthetase GluQRS [Ilumatobacteraceae bacterium]
MTGRFAPSPTGDLHLGNLRTAAVAWLSARAAGQRFVVRVEDLDRVQSSQEHERAQLADLAAIGLDWDGEVLRQGERFGLYEAAIDRLRDVGLVYECYCSRREIRLEIEAAPSAPHLPPGSYPGTCRDLDDGARAERLAAGRPPALRLRTDGQRFEFVDGIAGRHEGGVDDVVLRRNDGAPAYNLAVVVDDAAQGVDEVVRGDDLISSTPRQLLLQQLLDEPTPAYLHVPLVLGPTGERLAKRDGAVTLRELRAAGVPVADVVGWIGRSLDLAGPDEAITLDRLVERFDPGLVPRTPCPMPDLARPRGR